MAPVKQFCKSGHSIALVGRYPTGTCKACQKQAAKDWIQRNKTKAQKMMRNSNWRTDGINITVEEYDLLYAKQNGYCAICGKHQSQLRTRLAVDHDHSTGKIRGLLCFSCNTLFERFLKHESALRKYKETL